MIKNEDISLLSQLIDSVKLASEELEKSFEKKDIEEFNRARKEILKFQMQINEVLA